MLRVVRFIKTKEEKYKRVYHRRKNNEIVEILCMKDATFSYKENGEKRLFFIVDCEVGDFITYGCEQKYVVNYLCYKDQSTIVKEMFEAILNKKKPLPQKSNELLQELVPYGLMWLDSSGLTIWEDYRFILEKLDKNANEFVSQFLIDNYLKKLCEIHEIKYLESIIDSKCVTVSLNIFETFEKSSKELHDTIEILKTFIKNKKYKVSNKTGYTVTETMYGTPCGKAELTLNFSNNFCAKLKVNNKIGIHTEYLLTDYFKDIKENLIIAN